MGRGTPSGLLRLVTFAVCLNVVTHVTIDFRSGTGANGAKLKAKSEPQEKIRASEDKPELSTQNPILRNGVRAFKATSERLGRNLSFAGKPLAFAEKFEFPKRGKSSRSQIMNKKNMEKNGTQIWTHDVKIYIPPSPTHQAVSAVDTIRKLRRFNGEVLGF